MNHPIEDKHNPIKILLVEDDDVDALAIKRAFKRAKVANSIIRAKDGVAALELLRQHPNPTKHVILLDLNMPKMGGLAFLEELRNDTYLNKMIVFVLTTSKNDEDQVKAYEKHVAGYIIKRQAGQDFLNLVNMFDHFWRIVEMP